MKIKNYHFLVHHLIYYIQYYCVYSKPLIGVDVQQAKSTEFRYVVSLKRLSNQKQNTGIQHVCTGTLISQHDVLTAEHCILFEDLGSSKILVGSNDLRKCNEFSISWWISFDQWSAIKGVEVQFSENDIAVIRLVESVPNEIVPVKLSYVDTEYFYGLNVGVAGWGRLNQTYLSNYIRKASLKVLSNKDCVKRAVALGAKNTAISKKQMLCTVADPYTLLHDGDSGGPLLYDGCLIGVNKGTFPRMLDDRNPKLINLHVGIKYYKQFITAIMNDH